MTERALVERHLGMVRRMAVSVARGLPPSVEVDDLAQEGALGLMEAAKRYKRSRNVPFSVYANARVRGSMSEVYRRKRWNLTAALPLHDQCNEIPAAGDMDARIQERQQLRDVRSAVIRLPDDERRVIQLLVYERVGAPRAAGALGITIRRVLELHTSALERLRGSLRHLRATV